MHEIVSSRKRPTGIDVFWEEGEEGAKKRDFFSFSELIDMKINAMDLLDNPRFYMIEGKNHRIVAGNRRCCT